MNKVIGFIIENTSSLPYTHIFNAALKTRVYIIDSKDSKLCAIHNNLLLKLQQD
jgi:hypothetical protein